MNETAPLVSVILPTYNRARVLPRAIASVLAQTFRDLELIVVDDGSTDDTAAVVAAIPDSRLRYLPGTVNLGDSGARNRGAAQARGKWLAFQDSDDEWVPNNLEHQLACATAHPDAVVIGASSIRVAGARVDMHRWPSDRDGSVPMNCWMEEPIANLQAMLIRIDCLRELGGFDEQFRVMGDADFVFRVFASGSRFVQATGHIAAVLHETPGSLVSDDGKAVDALNRLLLRHGRLLRQHAKAHAALWYTLALRQLHAASLRESRRSALAAIAARPLWWRPRGFVLLSFLGAGRLMRLRSFSQRIRGVRD